MKPSAATALVATVLALAVGLALAPATNAQPLAASAVPDYLGTWKLSAEIQGNAVELTLEIADRSGQVAAAITSAMSPQPSLMDQITQTEAGLDLAYAASYQGNSFRMHVKVKAADGKLTGTFGDENGMFSAPITGERQA